MVTPLAPGDAGKEGGRDWWKAIVVVTQCDVSCPYLLTKKPENGARGGSSVEQGGGKHDGDNQNCVGADLLTWKGGENNKT
jgi:hypothetical protein